MYSLDRTRKAKIFLGVLVVLFLVLSILGFAGGGRELIFDGYMNDPLFAIVMIAGFFAALISFVGLLVVNALEKDIAEWLKILDKRIAEKDK